MSDAIDEEMRAKIAAAKERLGAPAGSDTPAWNEKLRTVDELRAILKKFRRAMGSIGNPGTIEAEVALRAGWIISSGAVEGQGDEVFHVFMLTNGAIFYFSGDPSPPIEFTGKWFLGDSIPALEAKIPDTVAKIMAEHGAKWPAGLSGQAPA
ncbi:MAG: hypothetical protein WD627_02820 [Actinomycetota bacterium]